MKTETDTIHPDQIRELVREGYGSIAAAGGACCSAKPSCCGTPQAAWSFLPFFLGSIACSLILTALFNDTRGSILLAMLFHFQMNNPLWPDAQPHDMYVYVLAGVLIVWLNRRTLFSREQAVTEILPASRTAEASP